jgi:predicted HTH domain antitoxin
MKTKTLRIPEDILESVSYRAKKEDVEESTAMRQLIKLGIIEYAAQLYKRGEITLQEAARLSHVSLRKMLDILLEKGIRGNITMEQQQKALRLAKKME